LPLTDGATMMRNEDLDMYGEPSESNFATIYEIAQHLTPTASDSVIEHARTQIRQLFAAILRDEQTTDFSFAQLVDFVKSNTSSITRRDLAAVFLRLLSAPKLLPENNAANQLHTKLVRLFEAAIPDVLKKYNISEKQQTHEKIQRLQDLHVQRAYLQVGGGCSRVLV
jgi:hypothetical protein